jgi:two-component system, sensor histidine kinase
MIPGNQPLVPSIEALWFGDDDAGQALLHMLATSTNDGIWDWDIASGRVYYSPRWLEHIGETPGSIPEHIDSFLDRIHADDLAMVHARLQEYFEGKAEEYRIEFRIRHRDGSWRWIMSRGVALRNADGLAFRAAGTHTDITDRIEAAERLEKQIAERTADLRVARDRAELAAAATSKFLAATSHDIRQPLQAMALLLGGLHSQVRSESGQRTLHAVEQSLIASMEMLDSLLEFSRLDAGALRPSVDAVALNDLLEAAVAAFQAEADRKGIELRHVATDAVVRTDPQLFGRILRNLISNAIKYTSEGRVLVGCRRQGDKVGVEIWDTGCGIDPDRQRQIFWEFVQAKKGHASGLGLGLAIVERLSKLLGHEVGLRSWPDRGSVFSVRLARTGSARPEPFAPSAAPRMWIGVRHVAVLEDSSEIAVALRQLLTDWGCIVLHATGIDQMLALLGSRKPDLVIADWHLADNGDGFDALDRLEAHVGGKLPSLVLTGDYDFAALEQANKARRTVIHKPVLPKVLHAVMQAELARPLG